MYQINAKSIAGRVAVSRAGARLRRLPTIVLGTGQAIKIAPGRHVKITEAALQANIGVLRMFADVIDIIHVESGALMNHLLSSETSAPAPNLPPEPAPVEEPEVVEEVAPEPPEEPAPEPEVVEEPAPVEPEPEVVEEPAPEPVEEKPKKKRGRRKKKTEETGES